MNALCNLIPTLASPGGGDSDSPQVVGWKKEPFSAKMVTFSKPLHLAPTEVPIPEIEQTV